MAVSRGFTLPQLMFFVVVVGLFPIGLMHYDDARRTDDRAAYEKKLAADGCRLASESRTDSGKFRGARYECPAGRVVTLGVYE